MTVTTTGAFLASQNASRAATVASDSVRVLSDKEWLVAGFLGVIFVAFIVVLTLWAIHEAREAIQEPHAKRFQDKPEHYASATVIPIRKRHP